MKISKSQAKQWLQNNPTAKVNPALVKAVDKYNGRVEASELKSAVNRGDVVITKNSFQIKSKNVPSKSSSVKFEASKSDKSSGAPRGLIAVGSVLGGLSIMASSLSKGNVKSGALLGIGVMVAGPLLASRMR